MEEEGEDCHESLFSLEMLVESARVEPRLLPAPVPAVAAFRPAVALRLLDFPTLLVRAPHAVPGPLVPFGRGKSCLFRLRPDALKGLLRRSPLYALLLALPPTPGPARLLGSCSVSLASAAEELLRGSGPGGRRGRFPLRDLMGEPVGELGLSYRLSNLGISLGHLGQGAAPRELHVEEEEEEEEEELPPPPPPPSPPPAVPLNPQGRMGLNLDLIPEGDEESDSAPESSSIRSCSSIASEPQPSWKGLFRELETNVFCPPPMYYSRHAESPRLAPKIPQFVKVVTPRESLRKEEITLPPVMPVKAEPSSGVQEAAPFLQNLGSTQLLKQTLSQLPLLNALLVELSLLNSQPLQPTLSTVHPQLAWLYRNVDEGTKVSPASANNVYTCQEDKKAGLHRKEKERSPSPKLKRNRTDNLKCLSPSIQLTYASKRYTKPAVCERHGSPEKNSAKENSPPKRKLTYGLTNTLWLRLQRTNPSVIKTHDKREHRRKKADLLIEKRGKRSTKGKVFQDFPECQLKSHGYHDEKGISDQNAQFNENVETLIQSSVDQDGSTSIKAVALDLQSSVIASSVKVSKNTKEKGSSEVADSAFKEKSLKVHLPKVSLQNTEAVESKIDIDAEKCVQHDDFNLPTLHNHCQSSHGLKNPADAVASCENTVYSEDFTNGDSSSTSLETPESSPIPLHVNPEQSQGVMDSDTNMSERSLTPESVSTLFPIPSSTSPVQSFKKTSDLKSNRKNTVATLNELSEDESPPARTVEEEFTAQHIEKEGNKDVQTFEDSQVSSDTNSNIEKGQSSVEKSHSLRTSQVSSYIPSNVSDLDLSGFEESKTSDKEEDNNFEMLYIANQCKHVSELVINKLPGYTM